MSRPDLLRRALLCAAVPMGILLIVLQTGDGFPPYRDFIQYWSAAVVHLRGGNPYSGEELLVVQREAAGDPHLEHAVMMWNPPPALLVAMPFGLLPPRVALVLWELGQILLVVASVRLLWRVYRGPPGRGWDWGIAILFSPTLLLVMYGQIGGLCLFGLAGFAAAHARSRPGLAGAAAALTALKPHLLFAVGLWMVFDAVSGRRGRITLLSGAGTLLAASAVVGVTNPGVYAHYLSALTAPASTTAQLQPHDWPLPVISYWFRVWLAPDRFWVQFVPMVVASGGVLVTYLRRGTRGRWSRELPWLVVLSVLAAPYGAWVFDLVVLLVPVTQAVAVLARRHPPTSIALIVSLIMLCLFFLTMPLFMVPLLRTKELFYFLPVAPVVAVWCWLAVRAVTSPMRTTGTRSRSAPSGTRRQRTPDEA